MNILPSAFQSGTNYAFWGLANVSARQSKIHTPSFLDQKTRLLSYLANPLVSVPYPKANNLQMIRSLSAPFQMGRMKREHIAILCLFSSKPRRASRPWHRLGRAGKLQIATLTSTMEINQEHEKLATRTQEKNTEKYTALFKKYQQVAAQNNSW